METLETTQGVGNEQQLHNQEEVILRQRKINDKLLHKYVISQVEDFTSDKIVIIIGSIILIGIGVWACLRFHLQWSVVMAVCSLFTLAGLYDIIISIPLSKGNLTVTSSQSLQHTLLQYKRRDIIGTVIFLIPITVALMFLAFELREVFILRFWGIKIADELGNFAFVITVFLTLIIVCVSVANTCATSKKIDDIIEDIHEFIID